MKNQATWIDGVLTMQSHYSYPAPHDILHRFGQVALSSPAAHYFCAADGDTFGLEDVSKTSCIANIDTALKAAGAKATYVVFALQNRSVGSIARWSAKWSKRTLNGRGGL